MGKVKRRRNNNRANPLGSKNANSKEEAKYVTRINTLMKNLESVIPNERVMALNTITLLCEEEKWRNMFLKQKLVSILLQKLINDSNDEIVVDSTGLLRNLCIEEGYDVCTYLWRNDFWVTITTGMAKITKSLKALQDSSNSSNNNEKNGKEGKRLLFDYADNLVSCINALTNGSDDILSDILENKLNILLDFVVECLQYISSSPDSNIPVNLYNSLLDLIYDFSSESGDFVQALGSHAYLSSFIAELFNSVNDKSNNANEQKKLLGNDLTKILVEGIRLQLCDMELSYTDANIIAQQCIEIITKINLQQIKDDLSSTEEEELINGSAQQENVGKKLKEITKRKENAMMRVQAVEIGVDIITAVLEIVGSNIEQQQEQSRMKTSADSVDILEQTFNVLPQFLHEIFTILDLVQTRVFICWNNFLWVLLSVSGQGIFAMEASCSWKLLVQDMSAETINENDTAFQITKYGCLWALLKSDCPHFMQETGINALELADKLIKLYKQNESEELHQRLIGCLTSLSKQSVELNSLIGDFFVLSLLSADEKSARCLCDVVNSIFEIYADKSYAYDKPVFQDKQYLNQLATVILPRLKSVFKLVDRNKDADLKDFCTGTFATLEKFIHYKKNE
ncbi:hypothetical protein ACO0QE_001899 [Hanseniaspora vineae]